jgi:hypothetical protein
MWLNPLRRLVYGSQRKSASQRHPARMRERRRPTLLALERLEDRMVARNLPQPACLAH